MRLESGPAKADRNWHILRAVLFLGFALYFVYDGAIGYPRRNRDEAEKILQTPPFSGQVKFDILGESPDQPDFERLMKEKPAAREQVHKVLGQPTFTADTDEYFISRYGYVKIPVKRGGLVDTTGLQWRPWFKSKSAVREQFYWAIIPALPGLWFLWRLYKAIRLRVVVDDEGLLYDGQRIAFADMISLRDYSPKGWIDLYYKAGEEEKRLRLDNEKVLLFDEIVDTLCQAKGFPNEVKAYAEKKAKEESGADEEGEAHDKQ